MIRLVPVLPPSDQPLPRLWLVFFSGGIGAAWWARLLRPGFRHVCAAAWYAEQQRWLFYHPSRRGTLIEIYTDTEFHGRFGQLLTESAAVLRIASRFERGSTPPVWHCVGAIKALLGVKSCALSPHGLYRDLLAKGAEPVEVETRVQPTRQETSATARGPGDCAAARTGTAAG